MLLNRILHGCVILIPSTAVGCFSKQFFVTPQVNKREEEKVSITSKLFIPHQGNCWYCAALRLSSLQAVHPCSKISMLFLHVYLIGKLSTKLYIIVIYSCKTTHLHFDFLTASYFTFSLIWRGFSVHKILLFISMYYIQSKCGPKLLYCLETGQLTEKFKLWLINTKSSLDNWLYCPETHQLTEWFVADWLTNWLTDWLRAYWVIHWLTKILCEWLHYPRTDQHMKWLTNVWLYCLYGSLTDWITDSTVRELTNTLNDLWLVDWLINWLYCPGTDQLTEWLMAGWLTEPTG